MTIATTTLTLPNWGFSTMDEFIALDSVSASDIFPNFGHLVFKCSFTKKECTYFLGNCNGYD